MHNEKAQKFGVEGSVAEQVWKTLPRSKESVKLKVIEKEW